VSDGHVLSAAATVSVTVGKANRKPTALAWGPASLAAGALATLDGLGSSDADGDALTYRWTQVSPAAPAVTFSSATSATPGFTAPNVTVDTTFTFQLVVNDGSADSDPVTVQVPVQAAAAMPNRPPVAQTSADLTVTSGDTVTLDASSSSDPDGDPRSYSWRQLSGSTVGLTDATTAKPTFVAPTVVEPSMFGFEVTVSDGRGGSAANRMYVTVDPAPKSGCSVADGSSLLPMLGLAMVLATRRRRTS
jgi:MYXO-CTERM domain-containing protein